MIKSLAAFAILAVSRASVVALPSFDPKAGASEGLAPVKSDRLTVTSAPPNCREQTWPNLTTECLHRGGSDAKIVDARPVSARR
jgi:hypothetical protein